MASRKKPTSAAMHEMRRLQHLGAEHMEGNFQHWVIENHCMLVDLVLAVAADENMSTEAASFRVFQDCLKMERHHLQVNLGQQIDSEGDVDTEEAA